MTSTSSSPDEFKEIDQRMKAINTEVTGRILLAVDSSQPSVVAVKWATAKLFSDDDKISLLQCYSGASESGSEQKSSDKPGDDLKSTKKKAALNTLLSHATTLQKNRNFKNNINIHGIASSSPAQAIQQFCNETLPSYLVIGSRALTKQDRKRLTSVSDEIVKNIKHPVLVAKIKDKDDGTYDPSEKVITVMAVDKSNKSQEMVKWFVAHFSTKIILHLVHVTGKKKVPDPEAQAVLNTCAQHVQKKNIEGFEIKQLKGTKAGKVIVDYCKEIDANLLVIGSRNLGKMTRALLGSVAVYCVHHIQIPVLVYKKPSKIGIGNDVFTVTESEDSKET